MNEQPEVFRVKMATLIGSCKTYPSEPDYLTEKYVNLREKILERIDESVPPEAIEILFESKQMQKAEHAAPKSGVRTTFSRVGGVSFEKHNFPPMDNTEVVATSAGQLQNAAPVINGSLSKPTENGASGVVAPAPPPIKPPKEWKREKTYDGSPIYRVKSLLSLASWQCTNSLF